jgi:hypothetical protein
MAFGKKKQPSLEERVAQTTAQKDSALAVFVTAAEQLDAAVAEADEVSDLVEAEIRRLRDVQHQANLTANVASDKALLIRQSFLGA